MRIVLATDGSARADLARDLLAGLHLPNDSAIRVVGVRRHVPAPLGVGWSLAGGEAAREIVAGTGRAPGAIVAPGNGPEDRLAIALDDAVRGLAPLGDVERLLLEGRPASAIVDLAREWKADLIVLGSRGHGTIESMLLGSVSREVVDHAPCPVLIARGTRLRSVILATDGSADAVRAETILTTWPMFERIPVTVIAVNAQTDLPMAIGSANAFYPQALAQYEAAVEVVRAQMTDAATGAAGRLSAAGHPTTRELRDGDPAAEIVDAARKLGSDLIVLGSRGLTGLTRLLVGSVAASVATHAQCSVLVVRETATG